RILVKFSWHIPDFPIYSDGTKPGTLHSAKPKNKRHNNKQNRYDAPPRIVRVRTVLSQKIQHSNTFQNRQKTKLHYPETNQTTVNTVSGK
ncbi:hypothetical protein ABRQ10_11765, partial [Corynebacterium sp. KPL3773]|uniref:hypothetical protein n=1 Tax=Corynebacterium sp. KPL3773 TaxID=3158322 RepID=UPI0032ED0175